MKTILQQKLLLLCSFFITVHALGQSTVTIGGMPTSTYSASPALPSGVTFSVMVRGSGAGSGSASGALSGNGFNTASPEASYTANKFYTFNITAPSTHSVTFTQFIWLTQLSGTADGTKFTIKTVNDNGTATNFGTASQTNATTNTFTGSVTVQPGKVLKVFLIPSNAEQSTGTVRVKDNSSFRVAATAVAVAPTITSALTDSSTYGNSDTYTIAASGSATSYSAVQTGQTTLPAGATINTATGVITFASTFGGGSYNISITATNTTGSDTKTLVYTRNKASQTITFLPNPLPAATVGDPDFQLSATASSGLTVSYSSLNTTVASVSGNTVTVLAAGTASLVASQAGNSNYNAATNVSRTLTVNEAPALVATPGAVTGLNYIQGAGPSGFVQLSNITGSNLTPVSGSLGISVTSGSNAFEVSNISNSGYGASTSYSYANANFNITNPAIYVRLKSGLAFGNYSGTITINGGGASTSFSVSGEVTEAATMQTTEVAFGPFCNSSSQLISVGYTLQGSFDNANFYVQLSDADGNFSNNFSNIIGFPNGGSSPLMATINANTPEGNYRVRVLQVSNSFVPTFSSNDNGSDIVLYAVPTLAGVSQKATVCSGDSAEIEMTGLLPGISFDVTYSITGAGTQTVAVLSDESGKASFMISLSGSNNNQSLTISELMRTGTTCGKTFNESALLSVFQRPSAVISSLESTICAGNAAQVSVNFTGSQPWSITYTDGTNLATIENISSNPFTFSVSPLENAVYSLVSVSDANCAALAENNTGSVVLTVVTNTWSGASDSNWSNPANWSCGTLPQINNPAVIAASGNNPEISGNSTVNIDRLSIETGSELTVATGSNLHVAKAIQVAEDALLTIESGANLTQLGTVNTNAGAITVKRDALMRRLDYVYWSAPVQAQNLLEFSPQTLTNRFYELSEATNAFVSVNPQNNFEPAKGYMIRSSNFLPPNGSQVTVNAAFHGKPNTGTITIPVANSFSGMNMIGNPYPSTIDADLFLDANPTLTTLYFWTHMTNEGGGSNYATYNATGPVNVPAASQTNPVSAIPNGTIQTGQGFIAATTADAMVQFTNGMRVHNMQNQFFRGSQPEQKSRIWLRFSNGSSNLNNMMVGYLAQATHAFDAKFDGELLDKQGSRLYNVIENGKYVIQGRALPFDVTDAVAIGFTAENPGTYTITLDNTDGLFASDQEIFIRDTQTGTLHNIKNSPYSFVSEAGTHNARLKIVYQNTTLGIPEDDAASAIVYKKDTQLYIETANSVMQNVALYDLNGRLLFEAKDVNAATFNIANATLQNQFLIVRITTTENVVMTRKIAY